MPEKDELIEEPIEERELEFDEWLDSIEFIDTEGNVIPAILEEDNSDDPEGDRGEI